MVISRNENRLRNSRISNAEFEGSTLLDSNELRTQDSGGLLNACRRRTRGLDPSVTYFLVARHTPSNCSWSIERAKVGPTRRVISWLSQFPSATPTLQPRYYVTEFHDFISFESCPVLVSKDYSPVSGEYVKHNLAAANAQNITVREPLSPASFPV